MSVVGIIVTLCWVFNGICVFGLARRNCKTATDIIVLYTFVIGSMYAAGRVFLTEDWPI
jgi:hypothetical protein